jgi:hypothetical protein
MKLISKSKQEIHLKYKITDLGECTWILGIKLNRDVIKKTISLSQLQGGVHWWGLTLRRMTWMWQVASGHRAVAIVSSKQE